MYVLFYVCVGIGFVGDLRKGVYVRRLLKCAFAYDMVCPEMTLCGL